jgi:hypothetical protein
VQQPNHYLRRGAIALSIVALLSALMVGSALAIPSDTQVFSDNFEDGDLSDWQVETRANGQAIVEATTGFNGTKAARITVPDYGAGSLAYIKRVLLEPVNALSAEGRFRVLSGGCDESAGYSQGNVPFFRFFDTDGKRVIGLYRSNGSACGKNGKMYVQHSGNFYRTGKNISFGRWYRLELRAVVSEPSQSLVQVYLDDTLVYESQIANNGILPFASVNIHNEHPNQVGDLIADDIRLATFGAPPLPTNPCDASAPPPTSDAPGSTVLADGFESFDLSNWSTVGLGGDGTATVQTAVVNSGSCAVKLHVTSSTGSKANLSRTLPAGTSELWADGWFNVQVEGTNANSNVPLFRIFTGTTRIIDLYRGNGNDTLFLRIPNGSGSWTFTSMNRLLSLNQWYRLKVHSIANGGSSTVEVWLDGSLVYSRATAPLGVTSFDSLMIGSEHFAQEGDLVADDIVLKKAP